MAFLQSIDNISAGKVLQVQNVAQSGGWSTNNNTPQIALTKNITPGSTSNHIIVQITAKYSYPDGTKTHGYCPSSIFSNKTGSLANINTGVPLHTGMEYYMGDDQPQIYHAQYISIIHVDTCPTATAVTYNWKIGSNYGFAINMSYMEMILTEVSGGVGD